MANSSKIFLPSRSIGCVSNHIPLQIRYIKSRQENLIVTCVGKSFHTYGMSHFGLLSVSGLHSSEITAMATDAYHVYTACDNVVYAWRRGNELKHTYRGHAKSVHLIIPFGPHLISVDESSVVKIWDIKDESTYLQLTFSNQTFQITTILHPFTYINKVLFGSEQGQMSLWNINKARLVYTFKGWGAPITCLEQAPALDVVAVGLSTGKIILHNLKYDETVMEFTQDWGAVTSISFRTDGVPVMSTGGAPGHVVFWDLEKRQVCSQLLAAHDAAVTGMVCLPNEPLMLTSSPDNTLKLWIFDMPDGGARLLRIREGHMASPNCIRFHGANGDNILSAAGDSTLRIFNTKTEQFNKSLGKASYNRKVSKKRGRGVEDPLKMPPIINFTSETTREKEWDNIAAIHQGLPVVTTWSYDKLKMGELKLLPQSLQDKGKRNVHGNVEATCLCMTHCGNFIIIGYNDGCIERFNIQSGIRRDSYGQPKAHESCVRGVVTDNLNQVVVSGGSDSKLKFWTFKNKGASAKAVMILTEPVQFMRSHQEGSIVAVALEDFSINIVDIDVRRIVRKFVGHTAQLTDCAFSPDSRWLVTSAMDCSIKTWDIPSYYLVDQFQTDVPCLSLTFSPTGEMLATAHVDNLGIFLWANRTLYSKVTLAPLVPTDEAPLIILPDCSNEEEFKVDYEEIETNDFMSPVQIHENLITLSGLPESRWQNLLNIDIIRRRNKPKAPPKAPRTAPFFLPTIPSLELQFDLKADEKPTDENNSSKLFVRDNFVNLTDLGKLLMSTTDSNEFSCVVTYLKMQGPSKLEFEIKSLSPENGATVSVILQFLKCLEFMLKSNKDFELAEAYLSTFLKFHGAVVANQEILRTYLPNIQSCHYVGWNKIQEKLMYNLCIVQNLKNA